MKLMRVAAAAINQTPLDWEGNTQRIAAAMRAATGDGVALLCLPELSLTGYGCEDAFFSPDVQARALGSLARLAPLTAGLAVSFGLPLYFQGALYNCAALVVDGQIVGLVPKKNLAGDGVHYEPRWFKPWPSRKADVIEIAGGNYPLGDLVFDLAGVRVGFEICEDAWVASRPGSDLASAAVDIILNPSASHFAFGKQETRRRLVLEGSRAFGVAYVYANLLGNEAGRIIYDGACFIASGGVLVAEGPRFAYANHVLTAATIDVNVTRMQRAQRASFSASDEAPPLTVVPSHWLPPAAVAAPAKVHLAAWEQSPNVKHEEFARAVSLGLFDYLRKSRSRGFVVSLSGGADSAAVAILVRLLTQFAVSEIGLEGFRARLSHIPALASARDASALVKPLLTCVYQATRNSSATTQRAAETVARAIGADYFALNVDPLVEAYVSGVAEKLGRTLAWETDDIALQNIQARVRAPSVWLVANVRDAILLSTSNRSEAAVGYATMDGDTAGGLSPIAGIDKAFLLDWLRWMQAEGPVGIGPLPELGVITEQQPTAELRPAAAAQTDEADLMPYRVLDAIEKAAIRDKQAPVDVFQRLRAEFTSYTPPQLGLWIERFFRLWARNQWKRERYAPSFHLDDENLDPKTWCRFPILSGGFVSELADLRKLLAEREG